MNDAGMMVCPSVMLPLNASSVEKTCSIEARENVRVPVSGSAWEYARRKPGCAGRKSMNKVRE